MDSGNLIPRIIHYCWFGNKEKPKEVLKYIESWKKNLPDFEIIEWNESNFPVNDLAYTAEAYKMKKYAFVSDVARLYALNEYGGVYFDTDIEVIKDFSSYLDAEIVLASESEKLLMTGFMAGTKDNDVWKSLLKEYENRKFILDGGKNNCVANTVYLTEYMKSKGLEAGKLRQTLDGGNIEIYPNTVFGAFNADTSEFEMNDETVLVHHCMATWLSAKGRAVLKTKKFLAKVGGKWYQKLRLYIRNKK